MSLVRGVGSVIQSRVWVPVTNHTSSLAATQSSHSARASRCSRVVNLGMVRCIQGGYML